MTKQNLIFHKQKHNPENGTSVECPICQIQFPLLRDLQSHFVNIHKPTYDKCHLCSSSYTTSKGYICHMYKDHNQTVKKQWFQCHECRKYFPDQIYLFRHTAAVHKPGEKIHKCNLCPAVFSSKERRRYHIANTHTISQCCKCNKYFSSEEVLKKHRIEIHKMSSANQENVCEADELLSVAQIGSIKMPKKSTIEVTEQEKKTDKKSRLVVINNNK